MERRQVKRLLALLKANEEYEDRHFKELDELPEGFKESFEEQQYFKGWINYHVTWDVAEDDFMKVVPLKESRVAAWNRQLAERVPYLTKRGEEVTPQQWNAMQKYKVETLAELVEARQKARAEKQAARS